MTTPAPSKTLAEAIAEYDHGEWGFTGTRAGMTPMQIVWTRRILKAGQPTVLRHGGAFGSDYEAHGLWRELRIPGTVDVWPADIKRALIFRNQPRVRCNPVMDPLLRNEEIVKRSVFVVATPHTEREEQRSGTWATIRHGLRLNRPTMIVWPSGKVTFYQDRVLYRVVQ